MAERTQTSEIARRRQKRWFEKFDWFVTSENYIVVAGRSGEQNELLVLISAIFLAFSLSETPNSLVDSIIF